MSDSNFVVDTMKMRQAKGVILRPHKVRRRLIELMNGAIKGEMEQNGPLLGFEDVECLRKHHRVLSAMAVDDPLLFEVCEKLKTSYSLHTWIFILLTYDEEGLKAASNLCEFLLQGLPRAGELLAFPLQQVEARLADAELYVQRQEAMGNLGILGQMASADELPVEDAVETYEELKAEYDAAAEAYGEGEFEDPFTQEWFDGYGQELRMIIQLIGGDGNLVEPILDRMRALHERDQQVDQIVGPWMADLEAREKAQHKKQAALVAEQRREERLAANQAKREARAAREAEVAALQAARAEEERVARTRQPPLHPDLADAIEMVNIVDADDRPAALRDLRETALAIAMENPQDRNAEHWASWAKEQMKLARQPDTEWSVIDGQFRTGGTRSI